MSLHALTRGGSGGGSLSVATDDVVVMDLPDIQVTHIDHGPFWPSEATAIGTGFFWDAWVMPRKSGYLVSDGYGGAHALLWGFAAPDDAGRMVVTGNVWDGVNIFSFGSLVDTGYVIANEWCHIAVAWDGAELRAFINGVLVGAAPFAGPRHSSDVGNHTLYVGGSDHINLAGRLAWIRAWDSDYVVGSGVLNTEALDVAFVPDRFPRAYAWSHETGQPVYCDFLGDYMSPVRVVPDRSKGYLGAVHHGYLYNYSDGGDQIFNLTDPVPGVPLPLWVVDPTCPIVSSGLAPLQGEAPLVAPATPAGALVFDSFSRRNQTYAFQRAPSLGQTEAGSLGPLPWNVPPPPALIGRTQPFGILCGKAVFLWARGTGLENSLAWVADVGTADMRVSVDRAPSAAFTAGRQRTGLCYRVQDENNFFAVCMDDNYVAHFQVLAGVLTVISQTARPAGAWVTLTADAKGNTVKIYTDGVLLVTDAVGALQAVRGAGLAQWQIYTSTLTSAWRADNFTVQPSAQ